MKFAYAALVGKTKEFVVEFVVGIYTGTVTKMSEFVAVQLSPRTANNLLAEAYFPVQL